MNKMYVLLLRLLFMVGALGAFLEDKLPLKILSITPNELSPVGQTNRQAVLLNNIDPITVVFTRPVIALGSDFKPLNRSVQGGLNSQQNPFTLVDLKGKELNVSGKLRWPTTYIARFDPDSPWATDLEFTLKLNSQLRSYDGVLLNASAAPVAFQTPFLSGSFSTVESKLAVNATGGGWSPTVGDETEPEAPSDAEIRYQFSNPVSLDLVRKAFNLTVKQGSLSRESVTYSACELQKVPFYSAMPRPSASSLASCVVIKPTNLAPRASYMLTMPAGSIYHELAGPLHQPLNFIFHGLYPFTFQPAKFNQYSEVKFRRLDLLLRHGLSVQTNVSAFRNSLKLTAKNGSALPFEVSRPDNVTLRVQADFEPSQQYQFSFGNAAELRDGFGQSFEGVTFSLNMSAPAAIFSEPVRDNSNVVFFKGNAPANWPWMARRSAGANQQRGVTLGLGAVTPSNFQSSLSSRNYQAAAFATTVNSQDATADFRIQNLSMPSKFFLRQRKYAGSGNSLSQSVFASITELGVAVLSSGRQVDVWVTNMTSGANVEKAAISVYSQQPWATQSAVLAAQSVTGKDGTASFNTTLEAGYEMLLYVTSADGRDQTTVSFYGGSSSPQGPSVKMVFDRGVYKAGDSVNLKVFATKREGATRKPFTEAGCLLRVNWENPRAPDWVAVQQEFPVTWDATYGTFFTTIEIPANATFGPKQLSLVSKQQSWIGGDTITLSDPRRPTASMEFEVDSTWVIGEKLKITAKVLTGTNQPIENAKVEVKWVSNSFRMLEDSTMNSRSQNGTFVLTTGADGVATKEDFELSDVKSGDSVSYDATYVGPTGEVITQSGSTSTATSKWSINLSPDTKFGALTQLPGFEYGWKVSVMNGQGKAVQSAGDLKIYPTDSNTAVRSCDFKFDPENDNSVCTGFSLPALGSYVAVASAKDDKGRVITNNYTVGRSAEDWKSSPLNQHFFNDFNFGLDKTSYAVDDNARIQFDCPFQGATLWLISPDVRQQFAVTTGANSLSFKVPKSCLGGCTLNAVLSVPTQPASFADKVKKSGVPISVWMDLRAPRSFQTSLMLNVPDVTQLNVAITPPPKSAPGDKVKFTVKLTEANGAAANGEVAIFVVDRAFLQVSPYPLVLLNESFDTSRYVYRSSSDNREGLTPWSGAETSIASFVARLKKDPWADYSEYYADTSDEDYFKSRSTRITNWGSYRGIRMPFQNEAMYSARGGGAVAMAMAPMAAPMAMEMTASRVQSDAVMAKGTQSFGAAPPAGGSEGSDIPVRTKFETAPLFVGRQIVRGNAEIELQLPDNIGTFSIRAYVVDATSRFGEAESEVTSTKPLTIQPMFPRFVRPGDVFDSGVIVTGDESNYTGQVTVNVQTSNSTVALTGATSAQVSVKGTTPVKVKFPMTAQKIGDSFFQFNARDGGKGRDAFDDKFQVKATQDPVVVATSMAIQASADGQKWAEGISFPPMIPGSGSLGLNAAVGRLPVVETLASVVLNAPMKTAPEEDAYGYVSRALFSGVFARYPGATGPVETLANTQFPDAVAALQKLTDNRLGLRWSNRYSPYSDIPDTDLNYYGTYAAFRAYLQQDPASRNKAPFRGMKESNVDEENAGGEADWAFGGMTRDSVSGGRSGGGGSVAGFSGFAAPAMSEPMTAPPPRMTAPAGRPGRRLLQKKTYSSNGLVPLQLVSTWAKALELGTVIRFYDAERYQSKFSSWDLLADTLAVLGLDWVGPSVSYTPSSGPAVPSGANPGAVLNLKSLQDNFDEVSYGGQVKLALAFVLRGEYNPLVGRVVNQTLERILVQGRTAYLKAGKGSNNAAPVTVQAAALELLALTSVAHPFVEKLANFLAQGNAGNAGSLYSFSSNGNALSGLAFAVYDQAKNNTQADATLAVTSGSQSLLNATFRGVKSAPVTARINPDNLPSATRQGDNAITAPQGLEFVAKGTGEVSVAALMNFVPAQISPDPIYRGIYVERLVQKAVDGKPSGPALQLVQQGDFVVVTVQITTPDDISGVSIQDLLPGGLEAIEKEAAAQPPIIFASPSFTRGQPMMMGQSSSRSSYIPWRDPFGPAIVYPDRVTWQADWLRQGTYSVSYTAVAVTTGTFLHPPVKAVSLPQPEVMGLSGGGFMVVSEDLIALAQQEQYLKDRKVPPIQTLSPKECKAACPASGYCNLRTGECQPAVETRMLTPDSPAGKAAAPTAKTTAAAPTGKASSPTTAGKAGKAGKKAKAGKLAKAQP